MWELSHNVLGANACKALGTFLYLIHNSKNKMLSGGHCYLSFVTGNTQNMRIKMKIFYCLMGSSGQKVLTWDLR